MTALYTARYCIELSDFFEQKQWFICSNFLKNHKVKRQTRTSSKNNIEKGIFLVFVLSFILGCSCSQHISRTC